MIEVSDFKRGLCMLYKDMPVIIVDVSFSTPTARGGNMIAKVKLRNLESGQLFSDSIRSGARFGAVELEKREVSFLYGDGERWHFMDSETFEQFDLGSDELGDSTGFLVEGIEGLRAMRVDGRLVGVELPNTVELEISECDPAIKGATAAAQTKRAVLETGLEVQVPPYLAPGEKIRVDTRDGHFVERVRD